MQKVTVSIRLTTQLLLNIQVVAKTHFIFQFCNDQHNPLECYLTKVGALKVKFVTKIFVYVDHHLYSWRA